jgi:Ca2+-binding RTX toxin-like protein
VFGDGNGSNIVFGSFTIHHVEFDYSGASPLLMSFSASFELHSESPSAPAVVGRINYDYGGVLIEPVVEFTDHGTDTIQSSVSAELPENVENLELLGNSDLNGTGNQLDNFITGSTGVNVLTGAAGADTVDGGAGADTLLGGAGEDVLIWDPADTSVQGGLDDDTLRMDGTDEPLDLTELDDAVITDVEIIDLADNGANLLTLGVGDVLAISSETDTLRIHGDGADTVAMGGGWTQGADQEIGLNTYSSYTQMGTALATLLIDTDITQGA